MNILYLTSTGKIIGGGEISLFNLLERLDRQRFRAYVISPSEGDFTDKIRSLNIPVIILPVKKVKNIFNIFRSRKVIERLKEIIRQHKIDLIHCNSTRGISFLGAIAARKIGIPFIWHIRVMESGTFLDLLNRFLVTKIIFNSKASAKRFSWLPVKNKSVIVHNGVDLNKFNTFKRNADFRNEIGCKEETILIGTIGRYHPIKGYEYFIKAAKIISQKVLQAKFLILGLNYDNNPYVSKLTDMVKNMGLADKIIFKGPYVNISEVFSSLDLFLLSSIREPFGRVIIEAMACSKPVVSFKVGGIPEIVEDSITGILVPPKSYQGLANAVIEVLKDKEKAITMGEKGRQRVEQFFSIENHVKETERVYLELSS